MSWLAYLSNITVRHSEIWCGSPTISSQPINTTNATAFPLSAGFNGTSASPDKNPLKTMATWMLILRSSYATRSAVTLICSRLLYWLQNRSDYPPSVVHYWGFVVHTGPKANNIRTTSLCTPATSVTLTVFSKPEASHCGQAFRVPASTVLPPKGLSALDAQLHEALLSPGMRPS